MGAGPPDEFELLNIDLQGKTKEDLAPEDLAYLRDLSDSLRESGKKWHLTPNAREALELARQPTKQPAWISDQLWELLEEAAGSRRWVMAVACKEGTAGAYQPIRHILQEHFEGRLRPMWNDQEHMWDVEPEPYLQDPPDRVWKIPLPASDAEWKKAVEFLRGHPVTSQLFSASSEYDLDAKKPNPFTLLIVLLTAKWKLQNAEEKAKLGTSATEWGVTPEEAKLRLVDLSLRDTLASADEPTRIRVGSGEGSFYLSDIQVWKRADGSFHLARGKVAEIAPNDLPPDDQIPFLAQETLRRAKEWLSNLTSKPEELRPDEEVGWPTDPESGEPMELPDPDARLPDEALVAEENERTVRLEEVLRVASPQQREIVLARVRPTSSVGVDEMAEPPLTTDEQQLLAIKCESWADVSRALDLPPAQVRQQVKRLRQKLT